MELRRPDPTTDFDEVLALVQACDRAVYGDSDWTADELREEWDDLDLESDAWLAVADGRIAGVMHCHGLQGSRVLLDGYVHPDATGRGAGSLLLVPPSCGRSSSPPRRLWVNPSGPRPPISSATRRRPRCSRAGGTRCCAPTTG